MSIPNYKDLCNNLKDSEMLYVLKNKSKSGDKYYKYNLTPPADDYDWQDAVLEARGNGIPIASFGDTADKFVFTPKHFGYQDFDYIFGRGSWEL